MSAHPARRTALALASTLLLAGGAGAQTWSEITPASGPSPSPRGMAAGVHDTARHRLVIANVFHAGHGNLHPLICYDDRAPGELDRAKQANEELLAACLRLGGSVTGEHGVGLDKRGSLPMQFADADLAFMARLRRVFDPDGIMNPGKLLPAHPACGEGFRPAARPLPAGTWI